MASERFYLSPIVGTGTEDDPFRAAVESPGVSTRVQFPPQNPVTGQYTKPYCLVLCRTADHQKLIDGGKGDPLPEVPLDGLPVLMSSFAKDALGRVVKKVGLAASDKAARDRAEESSSYRRVLRDIGVAVSGNPNWDERGFGISE